MYRCIDNIINKKTARLTVVWPRPPHERLGILIHSRCVFPHDQVRAAGECVQWVIELVFRDQEITANVSVFIRWVMCNSMYIILCSVIMWASSINDADRLLT
jgi:hypothetical protein